MNCKEAINKVFDRKIDKLTKEVVRVGEQSLKGQLILADKDELKRLRDEILAEIDQY